MRPIIADSDVSFHEIQCPLDSHVQRLDFFAQPVHFGDVVRGAAAVLAAVKLVFFRNQLCRSTYRMPIAVRLRSSIVILHLA